MIDFALSRGSYSAAQTLKAVSSYCTDKQILPFYFSRHYSIRNVNDWCNALQHHTSGMFSHPCDRHAQTIENTETFIQYL